MTMTRDQQVDYLKAEIAKLAAYMRQDNGMEQCTGSYFGAPDKDNVPHAACAIGNAAISVVGIDKVANSRENGVVLLAGGVDLGIDDIQVPRKLMPAGIPGNTQWSLEDVIGELNDTLKWTFSQIADWLDSLDASQLIPSPWYWD